MIYLDNNATTKLDPRVAARMFELMQMRLANPSSQHAAGRQARQLVEHSRESILAHCGARTRGMASDQLLFTSGGTESNNLAIFGLSDNRPGSIVVSAIEHPSVLTAAEYAAKTGRAVRYLPVDKQGVVCLEELEKLIALHRAGEPIALVSLMLANNETGVFQLVEAAAKLCQQESILIHTDAVQVLGKAPLDFTQLDVDAMTITAHKLHGPVGIGALVLRHKVALSPRSFGGFQQMGLRPGTEAPVLSSGFELAISNALSSLQSNTEIMLERRNTLQSRIANRIADCVVIGEHAPRLPHTLSVSFPGVDRQALQMALDMAGIACSTGSACASGSSQPSHVLEAMKLDPKVVQGGIRFSVSAETKPAEIEQTLNALAEIIPRLRRQR